jgi:glycosyltransferase involved in cell wall biosynthesis
MPLPWVGIRFMPLTGHHIGTEGYFRDAQFKGLCFLDEEAVVRYQARHPERTFEFLPDVANGGLPDGPSPLVDEIRERAAGRRIVLLCGSIEGRKNIRLFCETANLLKEESLFFAIVGQLQPTSLSREEKVLINEFSGNFKGNSLFRDIFFEDEREMNAIIQAADIIFAVYRDFPISSNLLSKASMFKKPVVVSDRFLMGRRTRQYGIGLAVSEHDATALAKALNLLAKTPLAEGIYSRFCEEISVPVLGKRLDGFLRKCIESGNQ